MFKFAVVIFAVIACATAKPGFIGAPLAYTVPAAVVAAPAPFVTATSSQVIARNYNGIAAAPIIAAAPVAAPLAKVVAAPVAATLAAADYTAPVVSNYAAAGPFAYSSPLAYSAYSAPLGYSAPLAYSSLLSYSSPLSYAAAASGPVLL